MRIEHRMSHRWEVPPTLDEWAAFIEQARRTVPASDRAAVLSATIRVRAGTGRRPWHEAEVVWITGRLMNGDPGWMTWAEEEAKRRRAEAKVTPA